MSATDSINSAQFTHTRHGSTKLEEYKHPKNDIQKSQVRTTTHTHRGVTGYQWQTNKNHGKGKKHGG